MRKQLLHIALRALTTMLLLALVITVDGKGNSRNGSMFAFPTNVPADSKLPVKNSARLQVLFRQSKSVVDESYRDNKASIDAFVDTLNNYIQKEGFTITKLKITATASPEGTYAFNNNLSIARANAIKAVLEKKLDLHRTVVETQGEGENWKGLVELLKGSKFYAKQQVLDIIGAHPEVCTEAISNSRKRRIKALRQGRVWSDLLRLYYPVLRQANNNIEFEFVKTIYLEQEEDTVAVDTVQKVEVSKPDTIQTQVVDTMAVVEPITYDSIIKYPLLAIKTNLLYDAFYTKPTGFQPVPNFELEYYMKNGRWSILAEYEFPWWSNWDKKTFFQMQNWQVEPRYYFKNDHWYNGHFVGIYVNYNRYDFCLKNKDGNGDQGEGAGAGISYGYVLPLGKYTSRWKLEFNIKVGYYETHYDPYEFGVNSVGEEKYYYKYTGDPDNFIRRNQRWRWFGPTGIGVTLSYDLIRGYKKVIKKTK